MCFPVTNAHHHATQHKYTQLDTSDTSSHNSLCSVVHSHIYQANHEIKHTEFF